VFGFNGTSAPTPIQTIASKQWELLFGVAASEKGFVLLNAPDYSRFSTAYTLYSFAGSTNAAGVHGSLASMADSDDTTLPDIQRRASASVQGLTAEAMKPFTNVIPGTKVTYAMVPIPGGEFTIGSPDTEPSRNADEGPRRKVKIAPFWMGTLEVRWDEYEIFMYPDDEKKLREVNPSDPEISKVSDAVTRPSKPYMEMSFGMGKDGYPAISMTQHAANKYCQWLSAKTGQFYRLPTEAEWEYACRAGTTTAYSFGDDAEALKDYAWFEDNSDFKYQKVGKKKPNPWGLFDMHGNVAEWCLDQHSPSYEFLKEGVTENPWNKATKPYPHVARGGSWDEAAAKLRSAVRRGSDPTWKMRDPQLPKSIWWLTDAQFVGFRLVRPLTVPSVEEMKKYWNSGVERE
jgi:formylglycine-generating enzyme required for sulfatase activity